LVVSTELQQFHHQGAQFLMVAGVERFDLLFDFTFLLLQRRQFLNQSVDAALQASNFRVFVNL
jgi:hypothetical protein